MIIFFRKFETRDVKIARLNSILITKPINLEFLNLILYDVGVRCDRSRRRACSPFIEISMSERNLTITTTI